MLIGTISQNEGTWEHPWVNQENLPDTAIVAEEAFTLNKKAEKSLWPEPREGHRTLVTPRANPDSPANVIAQKSKYEELRKHTAMTLSNCTFLQQGPLGIIEF